jgi:hypothetical protein
MKNIYEYGINYWSYVFRNSIIDPLKIASIIKNMGAHYSESEDEFDNFISEIVISLSKSDYKEIKKLQSLSDKIIDGLNKIIK